MSSAESEKCPICLEIIYSSPDSPAPVAFELLFVPEKCSRHWMHAICARSTVKADRLHGRLPSGCPVCRTPYTSQDLKCLLPPRRKLTFQTEVAPLDDTSEYRLTMFEHYNPSIVPVHSSDQPIMNTASRRLTDYKFNNVDLPVFHEVFIPAHGTQRLAIDRVIVQPLTPQQQQLQQQEDEEIPEVQQTPDANNDSVDLESVSLRSVMRSFGELHRNLETLNENVWTLNLYHGSNRQLRLARSAYQIEKQRERIEQQQQQSGRPATRSVTRPISTMTRIQNRRMTRFDKESDFIKQLQNRMEDMKKIKLNFRNTLLDFMLLSSRSNPLNRRR